MRHLLGLILVYALTAVVVAAVWTFWAQTENQENNFGSIVAIADGTAPLPFVKRRLLCDAAKVVARVVPQPFWDGASRAIDARRAWTHLIRRQLNWKRQDDPLLLSATALIALSALGFMFAFRAIVRVIYETPRWVADLAGWVFGCMLLGGGNEASYGYPYDIPHAFVFAAALASLLARSLWLLPLFAAASYSKETAVLLIPSAILAHRGRPDRGLLLKVAAMTVLFLVIRKALDHAYGAGSGGFWFPGRNARLIVWSLVFGCWLIPVAVVAVARVARHWHAFPVRLRRLTFLALIPLGLALFKGWFEERRQYMELLAIFGPLALQWVLIELGLERLCRVRDGDESVGHSPSIERGVT